MEKVGSGMNKLLQNIGTLGALIVPGLYPIWGLLGAVAVFVLGAAIGFIVSGAL